MRIALDYDGTYTADPEAWDRAVFELVQRGHQVTCVTARPECSPVTFRAFEMPVLYTSGAKKRAWCETVAGVKFDVWIDDRPEFI